MANQPQPVTMQQTVADLMAIINKGKMAADADLAWLTKLETIVLQYHHQPSPGPEGLAPQTAPVGPPMQAGPPPGAMAAGPPPMGPQGISPTANFGQGASRGVIQPPSPPSTDELRRVLGK